MTTPTQDQIQPPYDVPLARIASKHDNGKQKPSFDPDSPDVADPEVDPIGPAKIPQSQSNPEDEKRVGDNRYPPYDTEK